MSKEKNKVFILWGNKAKQKEKFINGEKNLILKSAHPSPFSAKYGFFGNNHFKLCNEYLVNKGIEPINWEIKDV